MSSPDILGFLGSIHLIQIHLINRYAINDAEVDWSTAEAQVKELGTGVGKSSIVSFRAGTQVGQKRKADAEDRVEAGGAGKNKKPTRRSKKTKR